MPVIKELIKQEVDGSLSFGDYTLEEKAKKSDYEAGGDIYKVKTYKDVTKLEKNELFVYESVPGTAVNNFRADANEVSFLVEGYEDASITLELAPDTEYMVTVNGEDAGTMKTKLGGKISVSIEFTDGNAQSVVVKKA